MPGSRDDRAGAERSGRGGSRQVPRLDKIPPDVRTVQLGEFTREHAELVAEALESRRIVWWYKEPGYLSQIWERGVRIFVDRDRLEEAAILARDAIDEGRP
jgi:hypothetical protein